MNRRTMRLIAIVPVAALLVGSLAPSSGAQPPTPGPSAPRSVPAPPSPPHPPRPVPASAKKKVKDPLSKLSRKKRAEINVLRKINDKAVLRGRLDYKLADKYDGGSVRLRRQFAAGWLWAGYSITNISSKQRKAVNADIRKSFPTKYLRPDPKCGGSRGFIKYDGPNWDFYLDSCMTDALILSLGVGGAVYGTMSGVFGPNAPVFLVVGLAMVVGAGYVDYVQRQSRRHDAVIFYVRCAGLDYAKLCSVWLGPQ